MNDSLDFAAEIMNWSMLRFIGEVKLIQAIKNKMNVYSELKTEKKKKHYEVAEVQCCA